MYQSDPSSATHISLFFGIGQRPSAIKSVICITSVCVWTDRFTLKLNVLKLGNVINTFTFTCSTATFVKKHPNTQYYETRYLSIKNDTLTRSDWQIRQSVRYWCCIISGFIDYCLKSFVFSLMSIHLVSAFLSILFSFKECFSKRQLLQSYF